MNKEQATRILTSLQAIKPIAKDKTNPHFKSRYADINNILEDVKPVLHANGLFILQPIQDGVVTTQIVDGESGEVVASSSIQMSATATPQQKGSEITYYRRYTLQSLLGLEAEDDDANTANNKPQTKAVDNKPKSTGKKTVSDFEAMKKAVSEDPKLLTTITAQYELTAAQLDDLQTLISK